MTDQAESKTTIRAAWIGVIGVILGVIGTGIFGIYIARMSSELNSIPALPTGLPSPTLTPTVVGTPIIGADIGSSGPVGFFVRANNISFIVDEIKAYDKTLDNFNPHPGYVFVIAKIRIINNSTYLISPNDIDLVDDLNNRYSYWPLQEKFALPTFPLISKGETGVGALLYEVPMIVVLTAPRLRLEPDFTAYDEPSTRLEVFLGNLEIESP